MDSSRERQKAEIIALDDQALAKELSFAERFQLFGPEAWSWLSELRDEASRRGIQARLIFRSTEKKLSERSGSTVTLVRELGSDERDAEVGRMFEVQFPDGLKAHVFEDELS